MARSGRFELPTPRFVVWCSIQLSYERVVAARSIFRVGQKTAKHRPTNRRLQAFNQVPLHTRAQAKARPHHMAENMHAVGHGFICL